MLISRYYADKSWTNHERKAAQERAFKENRPYILPIKIDDTEIPGMLSTTGYLNLENDNIDDIVVLTERKVIKFIGKDNHPLEFVGCLFNLSAQQKYQTHETPGILCISA